MVSTSANYKTKVRENERVWDIKGTITPLTGSAVTIGKEDLEFGGFKCVESIFSSGKLTLGGGIMSDMSATLLNVGGKFDGVNLSGANFTPQVGLELSPGNNEWIKLGVFNIDEVRDTVTAIAIKGFDNLVFFDRPFSDLSITFPLTAKQLLSSMCAQVGVTFKTSAFTNESYNIPEAPEEDLTCREMLVYIGQLAGGWVRCDREGKIEIVSIRKPSNTTKDFEITPNDRYSFKADEPVKITGVTLEAGDDTYLSGTDNYTIDLGPNPLFSANIQTTLNNIKNKVNLLSYSAIECEWIGDPAVQAGDIVKNTDRGGKVHYSFVGSTSYAFRGSGRITCGSVSGITSKYMNPTQRALKSVKVVSDQQTATGYKMDSLEQAINSATNLLVNAQGLHKHEVDGVLYFTDGANLQTSQKVWTFGSEGFGFSSNGWKGTYYTTITADNSITANTITASMIKTGLLQSLNGKSKINLDDGTFNLGDGALTWNGATLLTKGDFVAEGNTYKGVLLSAYDRSTGVALETQGLFFAAKGKDISKWKTTGATNTLYADMLAGFYFQNISALGNVLNHAMMYGKNLATIKSEDMVQLYSEGDVYINCGFGSSDGIYLQGNVSSVGNFTLVDGKFLMTRGGGATKRLIGEDSNRNIVISGASAPGSTYIYSGEDGGRVYFYIGNTQMCSIRSNGIYNGSNQRVVDFTKVV